MVVWLGFHLRRNDHASRCGGCGLRAGGGGCQYLVECRAGLADRPETGRRPERGRVGRGFIRDDLRRACSVRAGNQHDGRSEEHTSELQSLMRISYAVFCLKKKTTQIHYLPSPSMKELFV